MNDNLENLYRRNGVRAMVVQGKNNRKSPVVFDPAEDVDDITINVPHATQEDGKWGERRVAFVQSARDENGGMREWTHSVQMSNDVPRQLRVSMVHDHPSQHASEHFALEYTDYGKFNQSDPELAAKLPAEVYQAMLGLSVSLREVKLMTLESLNNGEFAGGDKPIAASKLKWNPAPGIYVITIDDNGIIESQWEMGVAVSQDAPPQYRSFARNVETDEEYGLFARNNRSFEVTHAGMSKILPEEVYASMVGLAIGAEMAREMTLELHSKGELPFNGKEVNKNRGFCNQLRQERLSGRDAAEQIQP